MPRYTVTVEYDFEAKDEEDVRSTNFWCNAIGDEGLVVTVDELPPRRIDGETNG